METTIRQQINGALALMSDVDIKKVWDIIQIVMPAEDMKELAFDLAAVEEIKNNPDCHEFITHEELLQDLGLTEEDLK